MKKKHSLRLSNDIGASYYYAFFTAYFDSATLKKSHNACGSTGEEGVVAYHNFSYVFGVESINVFAGIDSHNNFVFVKMLGEGKLTENSVDLIVFVEFVNERVEFFLGRAFGKLVGL